MASFFRSAESELRDTSDDLSTLVSDVRGTIHVTERLRELYTSLSNDMMNRALFLLTISSTTVLPIQLLSGMYGMNFAVMPELTWSGSYFVFLGVSIFLCLLIFIWFARRGFFAIYSTGPVRRVQDSEGP